MRNSLRGHAWVRQVEGVDHGGPKSPSDSGREGGLGNPIVGPLACPQKVSGNTLRSAYLSTH